MRRVRVVVLALLGLFLLIQFRQVDHTNPPADPTQDLDTHVDVPPDVKAILDRSCRDCHSHETRWPTYSYMAPLSWYLASHVTRGREEMNFSTWGQYDEEAVTDKLVEICRQVRKGAMPVVEYTWLHRSAKLTAQDVERLCSWTGEARKKIQQSQ
jgi:hypothetical protein